MHDGNTEYDGRRPPREMDIGTVAQPETNGPQTKCPPFRQADRSAPQHESRFRNADQQPLVAGAAKHGPGYSARVGITLFDDLAESLEQFGQDLRIPETCHGLIVDPGSRIVAAHVGNVDDVQAWGQLPDLDIIAGPRPAAWINFEHLGRE